jgi:hypothetical protein
MVSGISHLALDNPYIAVSSRRSLPQPPLDLKRVGVADTHQEPCLRLGRRGYTADMGEWLDPASSKLPLAIRASGGRRSSF